MSRGSPIQERFVVYSDPEISESGEILDSGNREDTYSEDHPFDYDDPGGRRQGARGPVSGRGL